MTEATSTISRNNAPSLVQLGARVFLVIGTVFLVLVVLWMWSSWHNTRQAQQQRMDAAAALLAGQGQSYLDSVGLHLEELADEMRKADVMRHTDRISPILQDFKKRHDGLGGAALILPDGQILSATLPDTKLPNIMQLPAWRDDFLYSMQAHGLSVNRPQQAPIINKWVIPLRYTVRDVAGNVSYVLQTGIFLENQQALWANLRLGNGEVLGLLREDGQLISRMPSMNPFRIYANKHPNNNMLVIITRGGAGGSFETVGLDGQARFGAYQRLQHYPLYAFISMPLNTLRVIWWQEVRMPLLLLLAMLVCGGTTYAWIAWRFRDRMAAIRSVLESGRQQVLSSSGVSEIDNLCLALSDSQERLRAAAKNRERSLLMAANAGTYAVRSRDSVVVAADQTFLKMLGRQEEDVVGQPWWTLLDDDRGGAFNDTQPVPVQDMSHRIRRFKGGKGTQPWLSLAEYEEETDGERIRYGLAIDVSEREWLLTTVGMQSTRFQALWQLATNRARSEAEKADMMLKLGLDMLDMQAGMIGENTEQGVVIRHVADTLGIFKAGELCRLSELCALALGSGKAFLVPDLAADVRFSQYPLVVSGKIRAYASMPIWLDDNLFGTLVFLRQAPLSNGFSDSDRVFMELLSSWFGQMLLQQKQRQVLETMAMTDSLTGLPNRRAAEMRFAEEVGRAKRDGIGFAVATCDLDRFKLINDHYGHEVGDEVLQKATRIMRQALREGDWMARWGGEEFILFLHQSSSADAMVTVERISQALKGHLLETTQGGIRVTASFGIGVFHPDDEDISRVLSEADGCMYEAKKKGRDCIVASDSSSRTTLWHAGMLQHALQENRIVPAYQVMVDLRTGQQVAEETLARLVQPDGKIIPAAEFIEAAEGINLIHAVDEAIIRHAMNHCVAKHKEGNSALGFMHFVNLSPQFLARTDLVQALLKDARDFCATCNFGPTDVKPIVFEITERQLLSDFKRLRNDLKPLLDSGFRLALDDFGSGYSSFLYLAELPVSFLKIEGWMVMNMHSNERVLAMVQSIITLARQLKIKTIAECIEDKETAEMLREMGVDWGQGYYFGRPDCEFKDGVSAIQSAVS